ncbi:hypothetical protein BD309DRAFT_606706 [Dichomitus squalens]|nr:hypothetical protein BD309DRAFT_606706 [Dichomitus squalens]
MNTATDDLTAIQLDPRHAKAWAKPAMAEKRLENPERAITAWRHPIAALPVEDLNPAEQKQRKEYAAKFSATVAKVEGRRTNCEPPPGAHSRGLHQEPTD